MEWVQWWVRWGPYLKSLTKIAEQTGVTPEAIESYPLVPDIFHEYCSAFTVLSSRRTVGMALNPISLADIKAYVDLFGTPNYGIEIFVEMIGKMDAEFIALKTAK